MSDERPSDEEVEMVAVQIQSHLDDQGSYACIDDDAPDIVRRLLGHTKRYEERVELVKRMHRVDMERAETAEHQLADVSRVAAKHATELEAAEKRVAELEALFQQHHGVHVSWVERVTELSVKLAAAESRRLELEEQSDVVHRANDDLVQRHLGNRRRIVELETLLHGAPISEPRIAAPSTPPTQERSREPHE